MLTGGGGASFLAVVLLLSHPKSAQENSNAEEGEVGCKGRGQPAWGY